MTKQVIPSTAKLRTIIVEALLDKKGCEVITLDLKKLNERPTDYFIIAHGESTTQVKALADNVEKEAVENGMKPLHVEGVKNSEWIIMDFADVMVHIFHREKRDFYQLEELWNDAKVAEHSDKPKKVKK
ncbi:MAG: ribosome silencing factor [Chitinophagales bacterium]|nr:ribosome silencing factor [Chitinophagales bacterium]MCO5280351.1 ribosome silencing factor [Chitinophagales bacterium]OJV25647.1 MAG: ribosome silencing factor [Bacteroidetes bacterium 37-13]